MIGAYRPTNWRQAASGIAALLALVLAGLTRAPDPASIAVADSNRPAEIQETGDYEISGTCTDENGKPMAGVRVRILKSASGQDSFEQVAELVTPDDGNFKFQQLRFPEVAPDLSRTKEFYSTYYTVVAQAPGRATRINGLYTSSVSPLDLEFVMKSAGTLSGRVTTEDGQPIEGATVCSHATLVHFRNSILGFDTQLIEGVMMDETDANGRYEITDLMTRDSNASPSKPVGNEGLGFPREQHFHVRHPQYAHVRQSYTKLPTEVDVILQPAATIEGVVADQVTGKPLAGARVFIQGVDKDESHYFSQDVESDSEGRYRFASIPVGTFNVICNTTDRTSIAIDSLQVEPGKVHEANIQLIDGSWIEGRIVDLATGDPVTSNKNGDALQVAVYGPSHPRSGAAVRSSPVGPDGRFGLRVAPGLNYPYIMHSDVWQRTEDQERYREGIEIGEGELVSLEFRVLPEVPRKKPEFSPVRLAIPVAEERAAAAEVRRLGGWYVVDDARHVVEVNMAYHETQEKVRYDNEQTGTDEILQYLPQFPHLKRLYLKEGQASDGKMHFVGQCADLEVFHAWNAHALSDAGIEHLRPLKRLTRIHVGNSLIGDPSMEVFGTLPELERLSLQGNRFTDAGVAHLVNLKRLHTLAISSEHAKFTNDVARHAGKLTSLEMLDFQGIPVTDAGIRELAGLTNLKSLWIGGAPTENAEAITDASVPVLTGFNRLETLHIHNCRLTDAAAMELAALPALKDMGLDASHCSEEGIAAIKSRFPEKQFNFWPLPEGM